MSESILNELIDRLKAVAVGNDIFVGRCPFCGAFIGFDENNFFCEFCPPNKRSKPIDNSFLVLANHRKDVLQVFVQAASELDRQYRADRFLFLKLTGTYVPRSQQKDKHPDLVQADENESKSSLEFLKSCRTGLEFLESCRTGSLVELLAKARATKRILRSVPHRQKEAGVI